MNVLIHHQVARPWGIWLIAILHTLYALKSILSIAPVLLGPALPHGWSPTAATWAPYVLLLYLAMLAGAWAVWAGYKRARAVLVVSLAIAVLLHMPDVLFAVPYLVEGASEDPAQWRSVSLWWGLTFGFWLVLWAAIETWYLFGSKTRLFFEAHTIRAEQSQ